MSDAIFLEMMSQLDNFSLEQKKSLIKALKKSMVFSLPSKKTDKHLVENLVGAAGTTDISLEEIKRQRLSSK